MNKASSKSSPVVKQIFLIVIFWLFGLSLALFLYLSEFGSFGNYYLFLGIIASIAICSTPFILWFWDPSPIAPIYITMMYLIMAYPFKLLAVRMEYPGIRSDFSAILWNDYLVSSILWALFIGVVGFLLGYYLTPGWLIRVFHNKRFQFVGRLDKAWPWRALLVFIVGILSLGIQISLGIWSSFAGVGENWNPEANQLFSYTFNYLWFGLIAAYVWLTGNQKKDIIGILICLLIAGIAVFFCFFLFGSKTWLFSIIIWFFMAVYISRRRISGILWVAVIIFAGIIAFTIVPIYRSTYWDLYGNDPSNLEGSFDVGALTLNAVSKNATNLDVVAELISRFSGIDNAAFIIKLVPSTVDFRYFKDLAYIPFSFIPSAIMPFKPRSDIGTWYSYVFIRGGAAAAPHPVGEGYLQMGFVGVFILFWIWGIYQAVWYRGLFRNALNSPIIWVIYIYFFIEIVGFGNWIIGSITRLAGQLIVLMPMFVIFIYKSEYTRLDKQ